MSKVMIKFLRLYLAYSNLFWFTETDVNDSLAKHIDEIMDDWKDIRLHNMAWLYDKCEQGKHRWSNNSILEVLPIVLEIEKETFYCW